MKTMLAALALTSAIVLAAPASAVTITGSTFSSGNAVEPFETSASQISVDFDIGSFTPITVDFGVEQGDAASYFFDSAIEIFTGLTPPAQGVDRLTLSLTNGATWSLGQVSGAFSSASASLNGGGDILTISLSPSEFAGLQLGSLDATAGDFLINRNGLAPGQGFSLALNAAAVPEPAAWAMMIAGFGLVGGAMRSRHTASAATA